MEDLMKRASVLLILSLIVPVMAGAQDLASLEQMRQTAEQGDAEAQLEMGILYEFGYHMPKNNVTALAWYLRSAAQGDALAIQRSDQLKSHMTPDEIDAADKLAKELMAKQPTPAATEAPTPPPPENPASSTPAATEAPPPEKPASSP
jgi:TPR repeat protein